MSKLQHRMITCGHATLVAFPFLLIVTILAVSIIDSGSLYVHGYDISFAALKGKRVLVVGGSGRVGGSVVTQLVKRGQKDIQVVVGGTSMDNYESAKQRWIQMFPEYEKDIQSRISFAYVDREKADSVMTDFSASSSSGVAEDQKLIDLVIHTAGPFQRKVNSPNGVLEACIRDSVPYMDVCDDYCTASAAKTKYASLANAPCILSTGCWPGVSSLMAKQLVTKTLSSYPSLRPQDLSVNFGFFTAGSGGAGVTLLVATFLILAEKALVIQNGRRRSVEAMKDYTRVNFGKIVGERSIAPLNLLETASVHEYLGVGCVKSLFGTAPGFWNALLGMMAKLPESLLSNEQMMRNLSIFSMPIVRLVDSFAGATNCMRCDVTSSKEPSFQATAIYGHENLEPCVGECVVAFACALLTEGAVPSGVWFAEEAIMGGKDASNVLKLASVGAHTTDVIAKGIEITEEEVWGKK